MQQSASGQAQMHADLERLESDLRVVSPVGIERAAWGWDRHDADNLDSFHAVERAAFEAIEAVGLGPEWDAWRRRLFVEVEGRLVLVAWRAEYQRYPPHVHK